MKCYFQELVTKILNMLKFCRSPHGETTEYIYDSKYPNTFPLPIHVNEMIHARGVFPRLPQLVFENFRIYLKATLMQRIYTMRIQADSSHDSKVRTMCFVAQGWWDRHPEAAARGFGRTFRSPTVFEDMVKTITNCNIKFQASRPASPALACVQTRFALQITSVLQFPHNGKTPLPWISLWL